MFTTLRFKMENSIGTPVQVCLYNRDGLVEYEITFPGFGVKDTGRRSLGSAVVLEFLLYYMTKPEWQLKVREEIYLDSMLDLF